MKQTHFLGDRWVSDRILSMSRVFSQTIVLLVLLVAVVVGKGVEVRRFDV